MGIYRNIILNYPYFDILSRHFREHFLYREFLEAITLIFRKSRVEERCFLLYRKISVVLGRTGVKEG